MPTTSTNVSKEEIEKLNLGQDLPYLLQMTPSLVSYSDAGAGVGYTGLRIRGSDASRINVTVNGIPLNDAESHGVFWVNMYVRESLQFTAGIYKIDRIKERVDEMIDLVGLQKEQSKKIGELSKGYKQRVGLAQALIHDPSVLILDEPTTGLDPNQLDEIRGLIKEIGAKKTVMLSTHIMI